MHPDERARRNRFELKHVLLGSVAIIALVSLLDSFGALDVERGSSRRSSSEAKRRPPNYRASAKTICELAIKRQLKSPSSADFVWTSMPTKVGSGTYQWSSYVDAQNSFGATVRTSFYCEAECTGHSECTLTAAHLTD